MKHLGITVGVAAVAFAVLFAVRYLVVDAPDPWLTNEGAAFEAARRDRKDVLIDFTATWSLPSVELSRRLDAIEREIDRTYVRLRIDVSDGSDAVEALKARYDVRTIPAVLMITTAGHERGRITQVLGDTALRAAIK